MSGGAAESWVLVLAVLGVAALLFLAALVVVAIMLWRSPVRLAQTVTLPLRQEIRELTNAVRANASASDTQARAIADHDRRLVVHGERLDEHDRRLRRLGA